MDLMAYWKWPNYLEDTRDRLSYTFNSSQPRLDREWDGGYSLWLVSEYTEGDTKRKVLLGCLVIEEKYHNAPRHRYGKYGVRGNMELSKYFDPDGPDMADVLYRLSFVPPKPLPRHGPIGYPLQSLRRLSAEDSRLLTEWSAGIPLHPRLR